MDKLRRIMLGALGAKLAFHIEKLNKLSIDLKVVISLLIIGTFSYLFNINSLLFQNSFQFKFVAQLDTFSSLQNFKSKINVSQLIQQEMVYSYADIQASFDFEYINYLETLPRTRAEKELLQKIPKFLSKEASKYIRAVMKISEFHKIDPVWVLSVMWTESHFKPNANSWAGAKGLMQIMPETKKYIYKKYKAAGNELIVEKTNFKISRYFPYSIKESEENLHVKKLINIELGIIYLNSLLKAFKNDQILATVAYNMGPGWTRSRLRRKLPVGKKNLYLDKVQQAYSSLTRKI